MKAVGVKVTAVIGLGWEEEEWFQWHEVTTGVN